MKCSVSSVTVRIGGFVEQEMIELDAVVLVSEHDAQHVVDDTTEQRGPAQHRDVSLRADGMTNGEEDRVARQDAEHGGPQEDVDDGALATRHVIEMTVRAEAYYCNQEAPAAEA